MEVANVRINGKISVRIFFVIIVLKIISIKTLDYDFD